MYLQSVVTAALFLALVVSHPVRDAAVASEQTLDILSSIAKRNTFKTLDDAYRSINTNRTCTPHNISVRKEWGSLSGKERIAYTDAVLCLQSKSSLTPPELIPGARSRFDDFVGTHINQTNFIHYSGTFLAWHRYFVYVYVEALRNECGYKGDQPYWNWGLFSNNTEAGPVFDGSATSMSGNGEFIPGRGDIDVGTPGFGPTYLPAGNGGGCVKSGPFANMTVNLGPVDLPINGGGSVTGSGLEYNPRCLVRDIGTAVNNKYANSTSIANLLTGHDDIYWFQMVMQGIPGEEDIGVHPGGHYTIAGNPGSDAYISPGDVAFYLHHGMVDRVWWLWQNQDLANRQNAISGTGTLLNNPPSPNTTLDTIIDVGFAGTKGYGPIAMRDLMSTVAGPFCYTYDSL
ncbi:related to monophenol monooxygenase (tyrosinase) [Rhynchosporium agropyri]|uniref:Related to monophenol monooxygenase (Tyrosinase) n=1 Tax=Rhynchosporium agropyri TaxID=914238 RepID=A0A1E1LRC1_9HELO|nr:related to monophenol monooxygenase (tyrosinase) [Rhynchosporium agropyri]